MANFKTPPIVVVKELSEANEFVKNRTPFILRGADIGACSERWDVEYLCSHLDKEEVKIHVAEFPQLDFLKKNFSYKTLPFGELLRRASSESQKEGHFFFSPAEYYYLRSVGKDARKDIADIRGQFPAISEDIIFPDFVPKENIFSSVFRIASKDVAIWTHYDVMDNALIQVKGRKRAVLFPPTQVPYLYLNGDKSEVVNIDEPDYSRFPKFKDAARIEGLLLPGDVLFIPAFWFHNLKYLDFGISVNVFWKELDPELYDKRDPYGNRDLLPAQNAFASVERAIAHLSKLPPGYKEFYYLRLIANIQKKIVLTEF